MIRPEVFELDAAGAAALADHVRDLRRREARQATVSQRVATVRRFGQWLAPRPLLSTTEADVEVWIDGQIARGLAASSRHTYLAHVRQFFGWCARRGVITADPTVDVVAPKVVPGRPRPIPEADLRLALITAPQPLRAWLVLAAYAGLRAGEIGRVRREHVLDTERPPLLVIENGKGGRGRVLPISATVLAELGPHLSGRRGPLWLAGSSRPQERVSVLVSQHLRELGLPYTCHSLRHRFGTQVYQRSRDLRMTQDMLGHASPATTQVYAAWDTGRGVEVVDELGETLRAAPVILPEKPRGPR